jgi:aspartyl-tRNA(Asn)/glutamyl-tRNA(Gln) amidotransferase subunit B
MSPDDKYELVIGLEVHVQLSTASKLFCGDSIRFNEEPNTQVSAISLAHPGTLPRTNKKAVEYAVKMGLACNCEITATNFFARKNYFYPDLPKGYQVSQHTVPICKGGKIRIVVEDDEKFIQLNRIHLEEDAGKSIHDADKDASCIDLNRAGTPLIEIVTEPCLHSADEAYHFLYNIRRLVRWLDISDGNMEEGSLRCDANISVRLKGSTKLGTKVEIKNLNSFRNLKRAIQIEKDRIIQLLEKNDKVVQQTRSYDANNDTTFAMRDKEEANDYRYFPDPDIAPFILSEEYIKDLKHALPELPEQLVNRLKVEYFLNEYDASQLTEEKYVADLFLEIAAHTNHYKAVANMMIGPLKQYINEQRDVDLGISAVNFASLVNIVQEGIISFSVASTKVLPMMMQSGKHPTAIIQELNLSQTKDTAELQAWVDEVLLKLQDKAMEYRKGKKGLLGLFVGEVKKISKGKADPKAVTELLQERLK